LSSVIQTPIRRRVEEGGRERGREGEREGEERARSSSVR
jgi:hypothetical protein